MFRIAASIATFITPQSEKKWTRLAVSGSVWGSGCDFAEGLQGAEGLPEEHTSGAKEAAERLEIPAELTRSFPQRLKPGILLLDLRHD